MRTTEVCVSRSVRVNMGNYEGTDHFVSMKAELDGLDDDEASATAELTAHVERAMVRQLSRAYKVRGKKDMVPFEKVARHHGLTHVPEED